MQVDDRRKKYKLFFFYGRDPHSAPTTRKADSLFEAMEMFRTHHDDNTTFILDDTRTMEYHMHKLLGDA